MKLHVLIFLQKYFSPHWLQQPSLPIPTLLGQREPLEVFRNLGTGNREKQDCQNTENQELYNLLSPFKSG